MIKFLKKLSYLLLFLTCFVFCPFVNASVLSNQMPTQTLNWDGDSIQYLYNGNDGYFSGRGQGHIIYTFTVDNSTNSSIRAIVDGAYLEGNNGVKYACTVGNMQQSSTGGGTNSTYSLDCPVDFSNTFLKRVVIYKSNVYAQAYIYRSPYITYYSSEDYSSMISAIAQLNSNITNNSAQIQAILNEQKWYLDLIYKQFVLPDGTNLQYIIYQAITNGNQNLVEEIQQTNQAIQETKDTILNTDTTDSQNQANDFFGNFTENDHGLSSIITLPLQAINSLLSSTCSNLILPLPYVNKNLTLPCMTSIYSQFFGSFFNMYQIITTGLISYWIAVRIYSQVKSFKDPGDDKIEVVDL